MRPATTLTLALLALLSTAPAPAQNSDAVLERLVGLVSTADLPLGFREKYRYPSPHTTLGSASIRYEAADGEAVMAMADIMRTPDMRSWWQESTAALRAPQHGLRMLGMGDGAYAYRVSNVSQAYVMKGDWRLGVKVEGGGRPAAEANRLAEQLLRKMYARFTGERADVPDHGQIQPSSDPPVVESISCSLTDPTYDDELTFIVRWREPEGEAVTVRWWYPSGVTQQSQDFSLPEGSTSHSFTMPGRATTESIEIQAYVFDPAGGKSGKSKSFAIEAPVARVTAVSGTVTITRRIGRLAAYRSNNLYRGDKLNLHGLDDRGFIRSSADIYWPGSDVSGRVKYDGGNWSADSTSEYITIGSTRRGTGFPATTGEILFEWTQSQAQSQAQGKAIELILVRPLVTAVNVWGWFDFTATGAGSSGLVRMNLKSHVVVRGRGDGSLDFYTVEGAPELTGPDHRTVVIGAGQRTRIGGGGTVAAPERFDPATLGDVSLGTTTPVDIRDGAGGGTGASGQAWVESTTVEAGVIRPEGAGLLVRSQLRVKGRKGVPTEIYAFLDDASGTPLRDGNQMYTNTLGQVCVLDRTTPSFDDTTWKAHELFIPYRELHLPAGRHVLQVHVEIYDPAAGEDLAVGEGQRIEITVDGSVGDACLSGIQISHNEMLDGAKGMTIHYQLDTFGRRDRGTFVVAHFELADGSKLRDFDGKCRDAEGNVAQYQEHVAQYDSAHWESAWLFVPYDQLHMAQGKHQLRLLLRASDPPTNRTLAQSSWIEFELNQN